MAVIAHVVLRGVTKEQYDAVRAAAGWLTVAPTGGLGHFTWWEGQDCHNVDAWESEQAFAEFGEQRLGPAMAQAGVAAQPEVTFHAAHEVFVPRQQTIAPTSAAGVVWDNVSILRSGYDAFARQDVPAVLSLFEDDIAWYSPDTVRNGGRYKGLADVAGFFSRLPENYAELRVEPSTFVDRGDTVVVIGTHRGRSHQGTAFEIPFVHVWRLRAGKALAFTEHFDTVKMNQALGLPAQQSAQQSAPAGQPVTA